MASLRACLAWLSPATSENENTPPWWRIVPSMACKRLQNKKKILKLNTYIRTLELESIIIFTKQLLEYYGRIHSCY